MTKDKFQRLAAYNRWANARLYAAALGLSNQSYRLPVGVFFGSLHGTLNHLLLTDRLWLKRLTGEGEHPNRLDAILCTLPTGRESDFVTCMFWEDEKRRALGPTDNIHTMPP
jgi:hypothetical protein